MKYAVCNLFAPRVSAVFSTLLSTLCAADKDSEEIKEYIAHSWYKYSEGDEKGLHPWDGETEFNYTGPKPPYDHLDVEGKYSWLKTPRVLEPPCSLKRLLFSGFPTATRFRKAFCSNSPILPRHYD